MSSENFTEDSELPQLPEMSSPEQEYSQDLSVSELRLLNQGNSPDWPRDPDDSGAGSIELNSVLQSLSAEAREELEFRAFGLTQVRARLALEELTPNLEERLMDEYDKAEAEGNTADFDAVYEAVESGIESMTTRHLSCW